MSALAALACLVVLSGCAVGAKLLVEVIAGATFENGVSIVLVGAAERHETG